MVYLAQEPCHGGLSRSRVTHEDGVVRRLATGVQSQLLPLDVQVHVVGNGGQTQLDVVETYHAVQLLQSAVVGGGLLEQRCLVDVVRQHLDVRHVHLSALDALGQPLTVVRLNVLFDISVDVVEAPLADGALLVSFSDDAAELVGGFRREVQAGQQGSREQPEDDFLGRERLDGDVVLGRKELAQRRVQFQQVVYFLLRTCQDDVAPVVAQFLEDDFAAAFHQRADVLQTVRMADACRQFQLQGVVGGGVAGKQFVQLLVGVVVRGVVEFCAVNPPELAAQLGNAPEEQYRLTDHRVALRGDDVVVVAVYALDR